MRTDPVGQTLAPGGLGVGRVGGPQDRDKNGGLVDLPAVAIDDGDTLPGVIHKELLARLTSRQRYAHSTGRDSCRCPHWQRAMALCCIWHPTDGVSYDAGDVSKRGTSAATTQRAGS